MKATRTVNKKHGGKLPKTWQKEGRTINREGRRAQINRNKGKGYISRCKNNTNKNTEVKGIKKNMDRS